MRLSASGLIILPDQCGPTSPNLPFRTWSGMTAAMKLNIAVVGAGIGGLATALLATADGHEVTLFERFEAPRPVG